ncbi:MAG: hypothetical protein ACK8QZ_10920, partial [Anaerolineales bacterium]
MSEPSKPDLTSETSAEEPLSLGELLARWWDVLLQWGWGESVFRSILTLASFLTIFLTTLLLQGFYHQVVQARAEEQEREIKQAAQQTILSLPPLSA